MKGKDSMLFCSSHTGFTAPDAENPVQLLYKATDRFNRQMQDIETRCSDPDEDRCGLMSETTRAILEMSFVCEQFEREHDGDLDVVKNAQAEFRKKTDFLFRKSYFMNRARTWPQGYPGDYQTLEGFYNNRTLSEGLGYYLDRHFLSTTLAVAVRERKKKQAEILVQELKQRKAPHILDIACGSCRELFELASSLKVADAMVTCVDFDGDALDFSAARMAHAGLSGDQMQFRKYNALKMINHERNVREFGMQDVIYSVGLFDYLDGEVLTRLLSALYHLLQPGGTLIAPFKDARRYRSQEYHWFVVWEGFFQRTVEDMWRLFEKAGIPLVSVSVSRDRSGVIVFFKIDR